MSYHFQLATELPEISAYFALRHRIFVEEQHLFAETDRDALDNIAYPIVAVSPPLQQVVGVVRIYEQEPGLWYGGRLGTHPDYRKGWQIGKGLINKAVTTANSWGCQQFLATVQAANVRFFQRLHWHCQQEMIICDQPHYLMEADLNYYPATHESPRISPNPEAIAWLSA
jgi:putative N-acetyltransferase (TIGR04045 family)